MDKHHLASLLQTLQNEVQGLDGDARTRLGVIIDEIGAEIEAGDDSDASLAERVRKRVEAFEVDHPTATGVANRVMQSLADMGI